MRARQKLTAWLYDDGQAQFDIENSELAPRKCPGRHPRNGAAMPEGWRRCKMCRRGS